MDIFPSAALEVCEDIMAEEDIEFVYGKRLNREAGGDEEGILFYGSKWRMVLHTGAKCL